MNRPLHLRAMIILAVFLSLLAAGGFWVQRRFVTAEASTSGHHYRYQCPMHPQIVEDHPGECPICHMRLMRVEDDSSNQGSPSQVGSGILVTRYRNPMDPTVFSDHPMKDSMGMDYIPVTVPTQALPTDSVPGKASFTLSQRRQQLIGVRSKSAEIRALTKTVMLPGRLAEGGQVLAQLLEIDAGSVRVGMRAKLEGPGGELVDATVLHVDGSLDPLTRGFGVRLVARRRLDWFRPGVYCLVLVDVALGRHLAVPEEAVLDTGMRRVVFIAGAQGRFEPRQVVLGMSGGGWVQVKQGLRAGERVVTSANFLIDSESRFQDALNQF